VKLTLDSTEPLEDAIRVVGSLYGVELAVVNESAGNGATPSASTDDSSSNGKRESTSSRRSRTTTNSGSSAKRRRRQSTKKATNASGNADVRAWARENGFTVKDRGRVPAAVIEAYRAANG
jgi:hypothetical protein